jgi:queuine tRNA-ribosyltransferase
VKAEEILGLRLITLHNLHFYLDLMTRARAAIENGSFNSFRKMFVADYKTREQDHALEKATEPSSALGLR